MKIPYINPSTIIPLLDEFLGGPILQTTDSLSSWHRRIIQAVYI
jgi:hypothetical protein